MFLSLSQTPRNSSFQMNFIFFQALTFLNQLKNTTSSIYNKQTHSNANTHKIIYFLARKQLEQ